MVALTPSTAKLNRAVARYSLVLTAFALLLLGSPPAWSQSLPAEAKKPLVKGDWATVLSVLEKADLKNPDTPCRMVAAHACLARNRGNEALILFLTSSDREEINNWKAWTKTLAEQQPQSGVAHYLQADALARTGDLAAAEQAFTRSIQHDPKLALALVGRGAVRALQRKDDPAYLDLMQATQVQPDLADAHASLGCFEVMQQNAEGALAAFNDALKLDPTSALAYNGRGCARYGLGKPDEAFVDFEMAATLCQALVIAEANQSFVEALVAKMIDEKTALLNKPGATLETKTGKVGPQSQLLDDKALRTAYEKEGFLALSQRLIRERQDLLGKMNENNKWMQQKYMAGVGALGNQLMAIEGTKVAVRYMTMGEAGLKGGLPGFFAQGGFYLAKDVADRQLDRALPEPVTRAVAKTIVAGISLQDDKFDWLGAGLAAGKERVTAAIADLHARADVRVKEQVGLGLMARQKQAELEDALAMEMARHPETFRQGLDDLRRITFPGSQNWSQMPQLADSLLPAAGDKNPVMLVSQDPLRSSAFARMLESKGVKSVTVLPVDRDQLARLEHLVSPSAVVGFSRDLDDVRRKLVPFFRPPDKFGGAAIGSPLALPKTGTFTIPGGAGKPVTLPLPPRFQAPSRTWDLFRPWTPKGNVGGVRTEDLEWVFVDKGSWPVMTFFGLAYEPPAKGGANQ